MASSYSLGEHYEKFVRDMVSTGRYASATEVVRDSLRLMEEREVFREAKLQALRNSIQEGLNSGPAEPFDMDEIRDQARKHHAKKSVAKHGR